MAGVKGKCGGPRANSGGKREGAGRKPNPKPEVEVIAARDMLDMLQQVALGYVEATPIQVRAAIAAVQYTHAKKGEGGKREAKGDAAKTAGAGKFAPASGPRLASVNGMKVASAKGA